MATAHLYLDEKTGARHIRALPYKGDLEGLHDGRRTHVFVLDVETDVGLAGSSPAGDFNAGAIVLVAGRANARVEHCGGSRSVDDLRCHTDRRRRRGMLRRVPAGDGPNGSPAFAPDGRRIAWLGHRHGNDTRYASELFVANVDGSGRRSLSATLDRPAGNTIGGDLRTGSGVGPRWRNAHEILTLVSDGGTASIRCFDADSSESDRHWSRAATAKSTGSRPAQPALRSPTQRRSSPVPIASADPPVVQAWADADLNPWLNEKTVVAPRPFAVRTADGLELEAWMMSPPQAPSPSPVVLEIHGGPHSTYGHTFFLEFQILAGCGFAVVYGNPRGSAAYGHEFAAAITADWGGIDSRDVLAILDAALAAERLDGTRVAAVGGSYGGFMTSWLLGHSDRFVTGISMRAVNDYLSFTGATDIGRFLDAELGLDLSPAGMRGMFERSPMRGLGHYGRRRS